MKRKFEVIIIALVLLNIYTLFKLNSIQNSIDNKYAHLRNAVESTNGEISGITSNINSILEKQGSILDSYEITFGDKLNSDLTVPVKISVTPKEYTEGLNASLIINEESVSMQKNVASFIATVNLNIFEAFQPKIILEQNGVQKIESIDEYYGEMYRRYLLQIRGDYSGTESYRNGKYSLNGQIELGISSGQDNVPEKISVIYDVNGKTVKEQQVEVPEMNKTENATNFINVKFNELIDLGVNEKLSLYAVISDNYGITYNYLSKVIEIDDEGNTVYNMPEYTAGTVVEISDKNGNTLYIPEYLH